MDQSKKPPCIFIGGIMMLFLSCSSLPTMPIKTLQGASGFDASWIRSFNPTNPPTYSLPEKFSLNGLTPLTVYELTLIKIPKTIRIFQFAVYLCLATTNWTRITFCKMQSSNQNKKSRTSEENHLSFDTRLQSFEIFARG